MDNVIRTIEALAWPGTVLVLVILLRSELRRLLERLSELKYGTFVATFGRQLEEAKAELQQIEATTTTTTLEPDSSCSSSYRSEIDSDTLSDVLRIADVAPRAAIAEAWRHVEIAARRVATRLGSGGGGSISESRAVQRLADDGMLPVAVVSLYDRLRQMRNDAIHTQGALVTKEAAQDYVLLALHLASQLDQTDESSDY